MSQIMNSPILRNLTAQPEKPYEGERVRPDRKGGWECRHPMMDAWITAIPLRGLCDDINAAFDKIADAAYACGVEDARTNEAESVKKE